MLLSVPIVEKFAASHMPLCLANVGNGQGDGNGISRERSAQTPSIESDAAVGHRAHPKCISPRHFR